MAVKPKTDAAAATPPTPKPSAKLLQVITEVDLYEPFINLRMKAGVPTEIPRVTGWIQAQIDAGLAKLV